jgi:hypothetical protein
MSKAVTQLNDAPADRGKTDRQAFLVQLVMFHLPGG